MNATTGTGDTALTYACENGNIDVADLHLQYSAQVNSSLLLPLLQPTSPPSSSSLQLEHESDGGRTLLVKASRAGHLCTVQFLVSRGADVNMSNHGICHLAPIFFLLLSILFLIFFFRQTTNNDHTPLSLQATKPLS